MKTNLLKSSTFFFFSFAFLFLYPPNTTAQTLTDTCQLKMGMNLTWINNYNYELPFADLMKSCGIWMTQDAGGVSTTQNTDVLDSIPADVNGYPLSLPVIVNGQVQQQTVATTMVQGTNGNYPPGIYTILYDGTGTFQFGYDATFMSQSGDTILLDVVPSNNGIYMKILSSLMADPVRNIRVLMPGTVATYQAQPFNQAFLDKIEPFDNIRMMNWGFTNNNDNVLWANRRLPTYYTQATYGAIGSQLGCAYEYMIQLGNVTGKDVWINVPHMADSTYIANMAILFRDSLNPNLKIYLEYSNEVWNTSFGQYNWVNINGIGGNQSQKTAYFMKRVFDIWNNIFGSQTSTRLVKIAGCFLGQINVANDIMNYLSANNSMPDALSPAAYFGLQPTDYSTTLNSLGAGATVDTVISLMQMRMNSPISISQLVQHSNRAVQDSIRLVFYEGGQHLIIQNATALYNPAIYSAQIDTGMYNLYNEWFNIIRDTTTADLFLQFHLAGTQTTAGVGGGTFGALQSIYDNTSQKYQALLDNIFDCDSTIMGISFNDVKTANYIRIYPNPNTGKFTIQIDNAILTIEKMPIEIYNMVGVRVYSSLYFLQEKSIEIDLSISPKGIYFVIISDGKINHTKKIIIN